MENNRLTETEFREKYTDNKLQYDAYLVGYMHGITDEGMKQLEKLKQDLEDINEQQRNINSGPTKSS